MITVTSRPLSTALGVEVGGADFTGPLADEDALSELRRLFDQHRLLLFRGQSLSITDHIRLCGYVRPVSMEERSMAAAADEGGDGSTQFGPEHRLCWHSDYTFTAFPLLGVSLYATDVDPGAAPTRFCNTEAALAGMPAALRARVDDLTVLMLANTVDGAENIPARTIRVPEDAPGDRYIRYAHPVVSTHRVTGTPFLMPSEQQASHFQGMSLEESDHLLDDLFEHTYDARFCHEHHWQTHDLVIWDNLTLQHSRRENPADVRRLVRRVTMTEKSMAELLAGTIYGPAFERATPT